jgi:hypothetical protein
MDSHFLKLNKFDGFTSVWLQTIIEQNQFNPVLELTIA